ncbi:hypothetical protein GGR54DRAFT_640772 [Hypoxylon sp. NC1633]|nr:hypothetical protein GGR54DRAFT_640772 [Hypoxylon sp. NC1633]
MVFGWQHWLSPRPSQRTRTSSEPRILAANDAALFEFLKEEDGGWAVKETHYVDNQLVRDGLSGPPLHIHWKQTEFFEVQQGVLGVMKNEKAHVITKDDGPVVIPPGTRHRFWAHESNVEDLIFKVRTEPQDLDRSFDENFLRNFVGYVRDCRKESLKPSIFQIILMAYNSGTVVSPPFWVPIWSLRLMHYILASWVAAGLLGYVASY